MKNAPKETDYAVEVEQGTSRKIWHIKAPTKDKAVSQANRILQIQRVQPARVVSVRERKP